MQIALLGDNLHEMPKSIFRKEEKYFKMSSSEKFILQCSVLIPYHTCS